MYTLSTAARTFGVHLKDKVQPCDVELSSNSRVYVGIWYGVFTCGRHHGSRGGKQNCHGRVVYIEKGRYCVTDNLAEELPTLKDCTLPRGGLESRIVHSLEPFFEHR